MPKTMGLCLKNLKNIAVNFKSFKKELAKELTTVILP